MQTVPRQDVWGCEVTGSERWEERCGERETAGTWSGEEERIGFPVGARASIRANLDLPVRHEVVTWHSKYPPMGSSDLNSDHHRHLLQQMKC